MISLNVRMCTMSDSCIISQKGAAFGASVCATIFSQISAKKRAVQTVLYSVLAITHYSDSGINLC